MSRAREGRRRALFVVAIVAVLLASSLLAGLVARTGSSPHAVAATVGAPTVQPSAKHTFPTPIRHVVVVMEENQNYTPVLQQTYEHYLAQTYGLATNTYALLHGSIPSYEAAVSGVAYKNWTVNVSNIGDLADAQGLTWATFQESMPFPCDRNINWSLGYDNRHNPFTMFSDIVDNPARCAAHDLPLTSWTSDVANGTIPNYSLIAPNITHDDHNGTLLQGDQWLQGFLSPLINNAALFSSTAFIVEFDEDVTHIDYPVNGTFGGHVYAVVVSPYSLNLSSDHFYNTYSLLTTAEWLLGIPGGTLGNDSWSLNPPMTDLFTFTNSSYAITFTASGLPAGTSWSVALAGMSKSSSSSSITFHEPDGTYPFSVSSAAGYAPSPSSGFVSVTGSPAAQRIDFTPVTYGVTFGESGLPAGTSWSVTLGGATKSTSGAALTLYKTNGTYSYTLGVVPGYVPSPASGTVTVNGGSIEQAVTFTQATYNVTFDEGGLPSGTNWTVSLNGTVRSSAGTTLVFSEPNGTYNYSVGSVAGFIASPVSGSLVLAGGPAQQSVTFTALDYNVTFAEVGLPSGTLWSVTLGGTTRSTTSASVVFSEPSGTYPYRVATAAGYSTPASSGSVTVRDAPLLQSLAFSQVRYAVTFTEGGLPSGTNWSVTCENSTHSGVGGVLTFTEPNGSFTFAVGGVAGYLPSPVSGSVTVYGSAVAQNVSFSQVTYAVTLDAVGLPAGANWSVTLSGTTRTSTTSSLSFQEPNGTYLYSAQSPDGYAAPSASIVVGGGPATVDVPFAPVIYTWTFSQSGLPSGTNWSVTLTGGNATTIQVSTAGSATGAVTRWSDGASTISFLVSNGSYAYLASAAGYQNVAGSLTVQGRASSAVSVQFSPTPPPSPAVSGLEYALVGFVALDLALVAAVILLFLRRRARSPPASPPRRATHVPPPHHH